MRHPKSVLGQVLARVSTSVTRRANIRRCKSVSRSGCAEERVERGGAGDDAVRWRAGTLKMLGAGVMVLLSDSIVEEKFHAASACPVAARRAGAARPLG